MVLEIVKMFKIIKKAGVVGSLKLGYHVGEKRALLWLASEKPIVDSAENFVLVSHRLFAINRIGGAPGIGFQGFLDYLSTSWV